MMLDRDLVEGKCYLISPVEDTILNFATPRSATILNCDQSIAANGKPRCTYYVVDEDGAYLVLSNADFVKAVVPAKNKE